MSKLIHLIAAARPNFMKIAPLYHALCQESWAEVHIVHTGQHYDINMSDAFFTDLKLPVPHHHLGVGSGSHAEQTGRVMIAYERLLHQTQPDMVVVVGDVNSTLACTLAGTKIRYGADAEGNPPQRIRPVIAHLEAGLRSFDRSMPEEINRIVTDSLADILWTPSPDGDENLRQEGVAPAQIKRVGNIMIDSLVMMRPQITDERMAEKYGLTNGGYGLVTLHRPSNVDDPNKLRTICENLRTLAQTCPLVFPVHPRTRKNLLDTGLFQFLADTPGLYLDDPQPYIRFMNLVFGSKLVVTDSGGLQEETTYLGIPCLTLRENTERPITVTEGTNRLCSIESMLEVAQAMQQDVALHERKPDLWDGNTASRVVASIKTLLQVTA